MVFPRFPQNSSVVRAYQQMIAAGANPNSFDSGCHRVSYSSGSELSMLESPPDGIINTCEAWTAYAEQASRFSASSNIFQEQVPWFYDSVSLSPQSRQILQNLDAKIAELRVQTASLPDAPLQMARGLYHWLTFELGINPVNNVEEQSLLASLENHRANCSRWFSNFKFAFERAGLEVRPVFVFESANGDRTEHIATLFQYAGQNYLMDPLYYSFEAQHRRWVPLSLREFWAWHFNNEAYLIEDPARRTEMIRLFERAEQLDPHNPHFPNNLGIKLKNLGETRLAEIAYQRSIQIDSRFVESYENLAALFINTSRNREGLIWARRGLAIDSDHPPLNYNAALAYFNLGRFREALTTIERGIANLDRPNPDYYSLEADIQAHIPQNLRVSYRH